MKVALIGSRRYENKKKIKDFIFKLKQQYGEDTIIEGWYFGTNTTKLNNHSLTTMPWIKLDTFPLFLGNAGFLYLISTAIIPVSQSMAIPKKFSNALNPSIVFVTIINICFGLWTAIRYGGVVCPDNNTLYGSGLGCIKDNIMQNLHIGIVRTTVNWLLVIDLVFTCVVFLFPINEALEHEILDRIMGPSPTKLTRYSIFCTKRGWAININRTLVSCAIAGVALGLPFFSLLTGLTGGFGNNILGFILPPIFYWKLQHPGYFTTNNRCKRGCEFTGLVFTFVFGIFFLGLTLFFFGEKIYTEYVSG